MDRQRIRVGDLVRIHKPSNIDEYPTWTDAMDAYNNTCAVVSHVRAENEYDCRVVEFEESVSAAYYHLVSDFSFNEKWVTLEQHAEDQDFEVGDEVIIHKPKNARTEECVPSWVPGMDKYDGTKTKINVIQARSKWNSAMLENCSGYSFNLKWLEHANDVDVVLDDNDLTDFLGGFVHG